MDKDQKLKYENELRAIQELYSKLQPVINDFGLNHSDSPVHTVLENTLNFIRERNKNLIDRLN